MYKTSVSPVHYMLGSVTVTADITSCRINNSNAARFEFLRAVLMLMFLTECYALCTGKDVPTFRNVSDCSSRQGLKFLKTKCSTVICYELYTVLKIWILVPCVITPCSLVGSRQSFWEASSIHLHLHWRWMQLATFATLHRYAAQWKSLPICNKIANGVFRDLLQRLYQGVFCIQNMDSRYTLSLISFTPVRKLRTSLRRFSLNL
jgi:hypothetical protein